MNTMFFNAVSCFFVCAGLIIALILAINVIFHRQSMKIMNIVWVLTGLWGHYFALFAYYTSGVRKDNMVATVPMENMKMDMKISMEMDMSEVRPQWQSITLSALHCGAGCTLADIIGEWFTYWVPLQIGGSLIAGSWALDFVLALILGVFFQFIAIREMEAISFREAVSRAFKADFFSLLAWQVGMYSWMAVATFILFKDESLEKTSWTFWFMMQIAMLWGFMVSYPVNAWLIKSGIKKGM